MGTQKSTYHISLTLRFDDGLEEKKRMLLVLILTQLGTVWMCFNF